MISVSESSVSWCQVFGLRRIVEAAAAAEEEEEEEEEEVLLILGGPALHATTRLSQRYPDVPSYGVLGSICRDRVRYPSLDHAQLRCDTPIEEGYHPHRNYIRLDFCFGQLIKSCNALPDQKNAPLEVIVLQYLFFRQLPELTNPDFQVIPESVCRRLSPSLLSMWGALVLVNQVKRPKSGNN